MTPACVNVAFHLARLAASEPDRAALHVPLRLVNGSRAADAYTTLTFRELNAASDAMAHGLTAAGISRGTRVAVMVPPGVDFFALTFALFKIVAVPVLIDPGMGVRNLGKCLAEAEPAAFIGIPKAHFARRLLRWAKKTIRLTVNVGRGRFFCTHSLHALRDRFLPQGPYTPPSVTADETAAILFTSGSTGVAKGVVYTHGIFAAQVEMLKATYGIEPGEVDLCTFPLFALFGPALGMTCVVPDMNPSRPATIDPYSTIAALNRFAVTNLFGSPAVIRRLGDCHYRTGRAAPTLRRVISAGAPASAHSLEQFVGLMPASAQVFTPYGATESLPVSNIGSREILNETRFLTNQGQGVCVGLPVAGMTVHVIPITDKAVPEWSESLPLPARQIGEFVVRGPVVTKAYFHRPEQTRLAKIHDANTGETLHRMGDVGYLDERGRLWYCGRKSHRVETPHGTLFTEMVEGVFNTVDGVFRTALVGVVRENVTYPVLCVEQSSAGHLVGVKARTTRVPWAELVEMLKAAGALYPHTAGIDTFLSHDEFPVDVRHNAKIFREKLAVWADEKLGRHWNPGLKAQPLQRAGLGDSQS